MHVLGYLILLAVLLFALIRLWRIRRGVKVLEQAITKRQPFLREDLNAGPDWDRLCETTNDLINETVRLQQQRTGQLAHLEATLGNLQEAVLVIDSSNRVLLANRALQAIFPRATDILNQRIELVLHSRELINFIEAVRARRALPQSIIEFSSGTNNGSTWVEATGTLIPPLDGQKEPWALFVLHDITKQRKLENIRKEFVANVSHELRTPLSIIKGYIETLVDSHTDMPVDDRDKFLKTTQRHAERLHSVINDLLVLSRLESSSPGLQSEPTDVARLIGGLVEDYHARPAAEKHLIEARVDDSLHSLLIDPLKLSQALENLLDNALKYTPAGSRIQISARHEGSEMVLAVSDNGPGIPEQDLPHLFERFYRVDKGRSRETGGTGLGLSIVKHIAQLHGGRVSVESVLGQGTTFSIHLPLRAAQ